VGKNTHVFETDLIDLGMLSNSQLKRDQNHISTLSVEGLAKKALGNANRAANVRIAEDFILSESK